MGHKRDFKTTPLTLDQANDLVERWHRHHKATVGHRFSVGVRTADGRLCGAAIVGHPTGRKNPQYDWAEVLRCVTDGTGNACSFLYGVCARVCKELGYVRVQTFILDQELGVSLKAAGWVFDGYSAGGDWNVPSRGGRQADTPALWVRKQRWKKDLV